MTVPELDRFSECLQCELCEQPLDPDEDLDLDLGGGYLDEQGLPSWSEPEPELGPQPEPPEAPFDELPTGVPLGHGWALQPVWDPYGLEFFGEL